MLSLSSFNGNFDNTYFARYQRFARLKIAKKWNVCPFFLAKKDQKAKAPIGFLTLRGLEKPTTCKLAG
jgi:hypothetical protein